MAETTVDLAKGHGVVIPAAVKASKSFQIYIPIFEHATHINVNVSCNVLANGHVTAQLTVHDVDISGWKHFDVSI